MSTDASVMSYCLFNVYGITVGLQSTEPAVAADLAEDFLHFQVAHLEIEPELQLQLHRMKPPYDGVPAKIATVYTPRNVSFHTEGRTYIDYSGRALGILESSKNRFDVYSEDPDLLYEVGYLFLLSQLGEKLDAQGMHRVHALAVSANGRAALVLLPMGGGKSTLASYLLTSPSLQLLSDDSPLIDRSGTVYAFPLRIGILPGSQSTYLPEQLRMVQRMEFGPKLLLRHVFFEDRIASSATPGFLFLGRRNLSNTCVIEPASRVAALRALIPNCVIGLGLFQGMEFLFNRDIGQMGRNMKNALSRLRNCIALVRRSNAYTVILGRDLTKNAETIRAFLEQQR